MYSYQEIYPRHTSYCLFPKSLDQGFNSIFCLHYQHDFPSAFVTTISEGQTRGCDGQVILPNGRLLGNAFSGYCLPSDAQAFCSAPDLTAPEYIDETVGVLIAPYSNSYYHWMFDVLPRLHLLRESGITCDKYLVNWDNLSFQSETLSLLGIPENKLIKNKPGLHIKAEQLVIPSLSTHAGYIPGWVCRFLRNELIDGAAFGPAEEFRRIYISRKDAAYRHVVNEKELAAFLNDFGFRVVLPGLLSFAEQVSIFSSAKIIIAPHGAGLANILFCSPETKVIEFFSPNYVRHHYWWLASYLGLDYYYFEGLGDRPPRNVINNARTQDITVSLNSADLIDLYRKFIRIKDSISKNNASSATDWRHISKLEGWLSQPVAVALQWLVRQLPLGAIAVEVGTSPGRASAIIASALPPSGLFYNIDELSDMMGVIDLCDMVFVNTNCNYQSVRQAILGWYPKLKIGGYMVFHNYGWLPGVKKAVMAFGIKGHYIADGLFCHRKTVADDLPGR